MGTEVGRAVTADPDLTLVAQVDPQLGNSAGAMAEAGVQVAVDFTVAESARANARWCAEHGIHAVIGTSGLKASDHDELRAIFDGSGANCLVAPNFAIGAVLLVRLAELAAPFFDTAEVIELHHDGKADAPSGTAMHTVERLAAASSQWAADPTTIENLPGSRGAEGAGGIRVHAVRMRGMVAHEEVLLGTTGQTLSIRHDSYDRTSFMPGVILAIKRITDHPGLIVGLDSYLGL